MIDPIVQGERLQKAMSRLGMASRREAERLIEEGFVKVNGVLVTELGTKVTATDQIEVNGRHKATQDEEKRVYILLNKPVGVITSVKDPHNRKTVIDLVRDKIKLRVFPVGRLDYDTSGLLLVTNDGELTHRLTHPSFGVEKTYRAKTKGLITEQALSTLETGVLLEEGITAPAKIGKVDRIEKGNNHSIVEITIHEGRNRQVRRMFEKIGYHLLALERIAFGSLRLEKGLKAGEYRLLTKTEVQCLKKQVDLKEQRGFRGIHNS